jgi:hypothetical protein
MPHRGALQGALQPAAAGEVHRHRGAEPHGHARVPTGERCRQQRHAVHAVLVGQQQRRAHAA